MRRIERRDSVSFAVKHGDCRYTFGHLATKQVQPFWFSKSMGTEQIASIDRIGKLKKLPVEPRRSCMCIIG